MSNVFQPLRSDQRAAFKEHYLAYLRARDGVPDRERHVFDLRERFYRSIENAPVQWHGTPPVDQAVFDRNHDRPAAEEGLDEATLWALCTAKVNRAERFGVELAFEKLGFTKTADDDPVVYTEIEEFYHTRILKDALRTIGVAMEMRPPRPGLQRMVRAMVMLPKPMSNVLVFCGEVCGVAAFRLLLEKARELFSSQPVVLSRIESLFGQILVDEVGHVHYLRSLLGPARLSLARAVLPLVAASMLADIPELSMLFGHERLMKTIVEADIDGAAAAYPDRLRHLDEAQAAA